MDGTAALAVLGLAPGACRHDIKRAYRRRALQAHPDHRGAAAGFRLLQQAYEAALASAPEAAATPPPCPPPSRWMTGGAGPAPTLDLTDITLPPVQRCSVPVPDGFERHLAAALAR